LKNSDKIILDLCGGSGSWSKPYEESGYKVINITFPKYNIRDAYFHGNHIVFPVMDNSDMTNRSTWVPMVRVYGILAAPPCTEFSLAKTISPRRFDKGMEIVRLCMDIIWSIREKHKLKFWALENPRCFLRQFLGIPAFTFEQWEFGDFGIKPTDLWGYFKQPKKKIKTRPEKMSIKYPNGRHNAVGWSKSAEKRAITPPGFAKAFFEANK
jgi:hypothetical protein